jgi:glycosyltransferase involved in cell wall biosynthesis
VKTRNRVDSDSEADSMKVVTVHRGSRDGYQVAGALEEAGLLEALVTDLYWPADRGWARSLERIAGRRAKNILRCRYTEQVSSHSIVSCDGSGFSSMLLSRMGWVPFEWKSKAVRWCDASLGIRAGRIATRKKAALLSYSYYGHSAFSSYQGDQPRILFQLHPHPAQVRKILSHERLIHPDCASSLNKEWELALPEADFERLVKEAQMPDYWLVASSFTKSTLIAEGIPAGRIATVPYGIDLRKFTPRSEPRDGAGPLRLLFVGTLSQRKGIKYLLQALELLPKGAVELTVCGRAVDDLDLFRQSKVPIHLHPSISAEGLLAAYRAADVFVFPSLAEGFGQVLLEAMASGLPILSTSRTAAPDLIRQGMEGFIVEPGNAADLALHIETFLQDRRRILSMGVAARRRAEHFTWARFRHGVAGFVNNVLTGSANEIAPETSFQS